MLRHNRDLRSLFVAQVVSFAGDWFCYVALLGVVNDLTDSSLLVSLVFVSQTLPAFLVSPVAGAAADRFDRRRIVVTVSFVQAVAALVLLAVGPGRVWLAFAAQATIAAFGAFVLPAAQAAVPNLARDDEELEGGDRPLRLALGSDAGRRGGARRRVRGRCSAGGRPSWPTPSRSCWPRRWWRLIRRPMQEAGGIRRDRGRLRPIADMKVGLLHASGIRRCWRSCRRRRRSRSAPERSASWRSW